MTQTKKRSALDFTLVRELAELLHETGLTEIEYDTAEVRVRVACAAAPGATLVTHAAEGAAPAAGGRPSVAGKATAGDAAVPADDPGLLTSPMVGVVYLSPEPGASPFVSAGDQVAQGDTVLLIEAMKVFNPIKAHRAGRIGRIFVSSGLPVEYGEPLLLIV